MSGTEMPMDHAGLEVMSRQECDDRLLSTLVGRIGFFADGEVSILPVNYRFHQGSIVFRTATGTKLEVASRHSPVAFEIDDWDEATHTGWSVLARGTAAEVLSDEEAEALMELDLRPWADVAYRRGWVRIRLDEITGRKIV